MTHAFDYLSVLVSIILGLGIAHLLSGVGRVINGRRHIKLYWPTLVWAGLVLIVIAQAWWADYYLVSHRSWTFGGFASTLLVPATLYLMSSVILPESDDMRRSYDENRPWFFGLFIALLSFSFLQQLLVNGTVPLDLDTGLKALGIPLGIAAIAIRSDAVQKALTIFAAAYVVFYVTLLFGTLRYQ